MHDDTPYLNRDQQLDQWHKVRDAIAATLRAKNRPIKPREVQGASFVAVGKCVDRYPHSFIRIEGPSQRSKSAPFFISWHPHILAWEPHYDEWGHILK